MRLTYGTRRGQGFTLVELAIVLMIVGVLIGGLMVPLSAQLDIRNRAETDRTLADAREALLGYAAANGRLPCPASATSNGQEAFVAGGSAANGNCADFYGGFLPAVTLGITPTDPNGFAVDPWGQRIRYAAYSGTINSVSNPFTQTDGIKNATMTSIAATTHLLSVCATATGIGASDCGTAVKLTDKAPVVFFSTGKNAGAGAGTDEPKNTDGDLVFISHEPTAASAPSGEFDDIVTWLSPNVLYNRLIAAGQLP